MTHHSEESIKKFFGLCDWLIQTYEFRKYLFDENPKLDILKNPMHEYFFYRIQEVFQESWIHQLAKLHDPAKQCGNINLSLDYIIKYGDWESKFKAELMIIRQDMDTLYMSIKKARNKLLSHNDYKTIMEFDAFLGEFEKGEDIKYFNALKTFCEKVSQKVLNKPFMYDDLVSNDIDVFMAQFMRGEI